MKMKMSKKLWSGVLGTIVFAAALFANGMFAHAATSVANFDPASGMLSVTGSCSGRYILIVIKNSANGSIWGSSNPPCVNGSYSYRIAVPDSARGGGAFSVNAMDNGVPGTGSNTSTQPVVFSPAPGMDQTLFDSSTITLDTSSLDVAPDDVSMLDSVLQNVFGIVTSAVDAVESSVVAATQMFAKMFTIIPGGSITVPQGQNQISGQGLLQAGDSEVFIANTAVTSSSEVIVTPTTPTAVPLAVTEIVDGSGFDVGVLNPQQISVSFTWLIIGTYPTDSSSTIVPESAAPPTIVPPVLDDRSSIVDTSTTDAIGASSTDSADASTTAVDVASTTVATTTDVASTSSDDTVSTDTIPTDATSTDTTSTTQ